MNIVRSYELDGKEAARACCLSPPTSWMLPPDVNGQARGDDQWCSARQQYTSDGPAFGLHFFSAAQRCDKTVARLNRRCSEKGEVHTDRVNN